MEEEEEEGYPVNMKTKNQSVFPSYFHIIKIGIVCMYKRNGKHSSCTMTDL